MRRLALGVLTFAAAIAVPATFEGPTYLVAVWLVVGLAALALVLTSAPVKSRIIRALRRELGLGQEAETQEPSRERVAKRQAQHVMTELSTAIKTASVALERGHWWNVFANQRLPAAEWATARDVLADEAPSVYEAVARAYVEADQANHMAINYAQGGHDELGMEGREQLQQFVDSVNEARAVLGEYVQGR